ncbi:hypothetical protein OGATHE_005500, partial [Ogataea polymorpha]
GVAGVAGTSLANGSAGSGAKSVPEKNAVPADGELQESTPLASSSPTDPSTTTTTAAPVSKDAATSTNVFRHPNIASGAMSLQSAAEGPNVVSIQSTEDSASVYIPSSQTEPDEHTDQDSEPEIVITESPFRKDSRKRRASESLTDSEDGSDDELIILGSDGETQEEKKTTSDLLNDAS